MSDDLADQVSALEEEIQDSMTALKEGILDEVTLLGKENYHLDGIEEKLVTITDDLQAMKNDLLEQICLGSTENYQLRVVDGKVNDLQVTVAALDLEVREMKSILGTVAASQIEILAILNSLKRNAIE